LCALDLARVDVDAPGLPSRIREPREEAIAATDVENGLVQLDLPDGAQPRALPERERRGRKTVVRREVPRVHWPLRSHLGRARAAGNRDDLRSPHSHSEGIVPESRRVRKERTVAYHDVGWDPE